MAMFPAAPERYMSGKIARFVHELGIDWCRRQ
jgi:hypothetical protein